MYNKWEIPLAGMILGAAIVFSSQCPWASDLPGVIELDTISNIYTGVIFDHEMHEDMSSCASCHHHTTGMAVEDANCVRCHETSGQANEAACSGCHATSPGNAEKMKVSQEVNLFHTDTTGLKRAYHLLCMGCHVEMEAASGCEDCHLKKEIN